MKAIPLLAHARGQLLPYAADTSLVAAVGFGPKVKSFSSHLEVLAAEIR